MANFAFDYQLNEQQIEQQLVARNLFGLFDWLLDLKGLTLKQRYTLRWLYSVGGQSILYLAEDLDGKPALVKMALLPYHRAAYISTEDISHARQRLEHEAEHLKRFQSSILPAYCELIYDTNPLLSPVRGEKIIQSEPFLLMEFLEGQTLQQVAYALHFTHQSPYTLLEWIAWQVIVATTDFLLTLSQDEQPCLYADFTTSNIFLTQDLQKPVRILDAGSLIPLEVDPAMHPPFTWAYTPPEYYEAYDKGQNLWPTPSYVMYTLGKVLWQTLTDQQLIPGRDPDLSTPVLQNYSPALWTIITNLIQRTYDSFEHLKQSIQPSFPQTNQRLPNLDELLDGLHKTLQTKQLSANVISPIRAVKSQQTDIQLISVKTAKTDAVQVLRYSPDGQFLAIASGQRSELWNAGALQKEKIFKSSHSGQVMSLDFDSSGQYLTSGCVQKDIAHISLWRIDLVDAIWKHRGPGYNGNVALNGPGDLLAAASKWNVATFYPQQTFLNERDYEGFADRGVCGALSKRRPILAVGGLLGTRLWDIRTHKLIEPDLISGSEAFVEKLAFGDNDNILATLSLNLSTHTLMHYSIMIWDVSASHELLWQVDLPVAEISDMRLSSNDRLLFASSPGGHIWVWDVDQKRELAHLENCGLISSLDFASQQRTLATATSNGEICIYHIEEV